MTYHWWAWIPSLLEDGHPHLRDEDGRCLSCGSQSPRFMHGQFVYEPHYRLRPRGKHL